ncbi:MAG TPA: glycosyltransferase family 39 protein [Candidatus Binataceae bacterium]|nr:glycosyltransferase family 39 protein [Candidatus Binataceae bacterium]
MTRVCGCCRPRPLAVIALLAAAAAVYAYHVGRAPLAASEAYSALAAAQASVESVARSALSLDPGKPVLYHLLLHGFCRVVGQSEAALRSVSIAFGVAAVYFVFALGQELFGFEVGFCAAVLWAFNPLAGVLARWARMYSMLIALALGHVLAMEKVRRGSGVAMLLGAGVVGSAMLYVHFGAILIVAADLVVIFRELRRTGTSRCWPAAAIACILFLPFVPITIAQSRALLFGHWMDWLGVSKGSPSQMLLFGCGAAAAVLWLGLAAPQAERRREGLQQCLLYALVPMLALAAGSALVRPMFEVRYVSPSFAMLAVVAAYWLDCGGAWLRNLGTVAIGALSLMLLPLCYGAPRDPWPAIAAKIGAVANPSEPIFFEAGFFSPDGQVNPFPDQGFPQGFFRVPFDYYFHGANPRAVLPAAQPAAARKVIAAQLGHGGAWLVSARKWPDALAELPRGPDCRLDYSSRFSRISVFHVKPVPDR